jgi:outer membrane protein TolC
MKAFSAILAVFLLAGQGLEAQVQPAADATSPAATRTAAQATAQAGAPAAGLSLAELRVLALSRSASLKKAGIAVDSSLLAERGDAYAWLPSITAGGKATYALGSGGALTGSASIAVTQQLWDGGKTSIQKKIDGLATESARVAARSAYLSALEEVDDAYYAVLAGGASVEAAQADLDAATAGLDLAAAKLEAGIIVKAELLKAQSEAAQAETALGQAKRNLLAASAKLASLTGLSLPLHLAPVDFQSYDGLITRLAALDDSALEGLVGGISAAAAKGNPSLKAAGYANEEARLAVDKARAGYLPLVSASMSNGLAWAEAGSGYSGSFTVSATIPLDLWNTALAVDKGKLEASSASTSLAEAGRSLDLDIRTAVYSWLSAARSIASSKKALDYAEGNYESVLESYRLSLASSSELSEAASLVSANRSAWNAARYGFLEGLAALRSLAGLESDDLLLALVP